jgi:2-polyprenyl-3-methyl-5-hydroxy-6-metoxy-1,4-benzoquinol methylase
MNDSISEEQERSNQRARRTWESKAVGSQRARSPSGTTAYFDEIRRYRFGYETPFIPDFFGFSSLGGKRVLEIGVGNGIDAFEMIRGGAVYTGLDITRNHLDLTRVLLASAKVDEVPGRVEALIEGDLLRTTLPGSYDVVYSFGVLHHIAHEDAYLRRIHGLLKPGGELRMAVYSRFSFFNAWLLMTWLLRNRTRNRFVDWQSHLAEHSPLGDPVVIKIRSRMEVQRLLEANGFKIVRYGKRGFVSRYLPILGRFLAPNGLVLHVCARALGWYHCFICRPVDSVGVAHASAGEKIDGHGEACTITNVDGVQAAADATGAEQWPT